MIPIPHWFFPGLWFPLRRALFLVALAGVLIGGAHAAVFLLYGS